ELRAVPAYQHPWRRQSVGIFGRVGPRGPRRSGDLVDDAVDRLEGSADDLGEGEPGEPFGRRIEIPDQTFAVDPDHAVADRGQGDLGLLLLLVEGLFDQL